MKKLAAMVLAMALVFSLAACGGSDSSSASAGGSSAGSAAASGGAQAGSSGKIAVIRNMSSSDHTTQFFAGCIAEGEALGYTVDTFMSDQDDVKMQNLMEQALQQDYDIWIVSHANEGYQYDLVSRAVEKGIKVVGFDCGGEHVEGVTYTSQDDQSLASISLDAMIEKAKEKGASEPVKFLELNTLGLIVPFDTRHAVIEQYEADGKLECLDIINPLTGGDSYSQVYTAVSTALTKYPAGELNGIWAASSGFLDGAVDAIHDAGRDDVVLSAIDISDTEIKRLVEVPEYICCAAVDPYVIGVVDVRLAVLKTLGVETPETYALDAVEVSGDQLNADDTMQTLNKYFADFGSTDAFDTDEIKALREKFAK
ncbi:substrate-binding domain-containing protein [Anaerofilum sp. BX8]|uniref:Substrate-binding domain-containing protein n=1 Tax=Anaerofilum hominis TaxID=2763016 RepID=A0A923I871_9FIRM|nr:substrate-binding domain-containing protein [Anaerofilum hominis]MBC5580737.1 substrate-binding domain-containing protein [Anaerofilum hominis]